MIEPDQFEDVDEELRRLILEDERMRCLTDTIVLMRVCIMAVAEMRRTEVGLRKRVRKRVTGR